MDEASKTKKTWGDLEKSIVNGKGIDIGCGPDPVTPNVRRFDIEDGDANHIEDFIHEQFDYVYSAHCLEHMYHPKEALMGWWNLVKPGGHMILIVPDEDLYEQGVFPSRFNADHKSTFTISKHHSWSSASINLLSLTQELPHVKVLSIALQDDGYDRSLLNHGIHAKTPLTRTLLRLYQRWTNLKLPKISSLEIIREKFQPIDQTLLPGVLAQIQCVLLKQN